MTASTWTVFAEARELASAGPWEGTVPAVHGFVWPAAKPRRESTQSTRPSDVALRTGTRTSRRGTREQGGAGRRAL